MLSLLLLSLMSSYAVYSVVEGLGSGSDASDDEEMPIAETEGQDLVAADDNQEVVGTDGEDTVSDSENDAEPNVVDVSQQGADVVGTDADDIIDVTDHEVSSIDAGDGDDVIFSWASGAGLTYSGVVNGGAGNDIIVENYYENHSTLNGGDGDDIILGGMGLASGGEGDDILIGTTLDGGDGDDTLFAYTTVHGNGEGTSTGGAGDDYIHVTAAGEHDYGLPTVTGGEGNDIFNVHVAMPYSEDEHSEDVLITDFDSDEDVLQISLAQEDDLYSPSDGYTFDGVTVEADEDDSLVVVTYTYTGDEVDYETPDIETIIRVVGVSNLTADNIVMESDAGYVTAERPDLSAYG